MIREKRRVEDSAVVRSFQTWVSFLFGIYSTLVFKSVVLCVNLKEIPSHIHMHVPKRQKHACAPTAFKKNLMKNL